MAYKKNERRGGTPATFKNGQPVYRNSRNQTDRDKGGYEQRKADKRPYTDGAGGAEGPGKKPYRSDGGYKKTYGKPAETDGDTRRSYGEKKYDGGYKKTYDKPAEPDARQAVPEDELPYIVMGRNAVKEAVKSGRSIDRILVNKEQDGSLREIISLARDRNIQIRETDKQKLDELCLPFGHGGRTGNHQGIVAQVPGVEYCDISDILAAAKARGEKPFVILLDGIEDPHNLGSIIRSAECAGAHGVIIPKRRSAGVTASACKASAGAVEYVKVARVSNLSGAIDRLKDEGLWIAGADMSGAAMGSAKLNGAIGLVIGNEGSGISELVKKNCDFLVSIPMHGKISSLNAAMAAAVLMFEKKRQDA